MLTEVEVECSEIRHTKVEIEYTKVEIEFTEKNPF